MSTEATTPNDGTTTVRSGTPAADLSNQPHGPNQPDPPPPPAGWYTATTPGPYGPQSTWYRTPPAYAPPPTPESRMRRSSNEKMLAGVCGGIAEHTGIDPVYVRLAFLVSLFWGGIGLVAYIAAALVMPKPLH